MRRVEFTPAARDDVEAAVEYYERDYPGRGLRLAAAVEGAARAAAATPSGGAPFPGVSPRLGVRRRLVRGFPYALAYRDLGDVLRVDAVAHVRRRPGFWIGRTKPPK